MVTNGQILESIKVFKEMCSGYYPQCTSCPVGFDVNQNGGSNCKLQYIRPKDYKAKNPKWKALD